MTNDLVKVLHDRVVSLKAEADVARAQMANYSADLARAVDEAGMTFVVVDGKTKCVPKAAHEEPAVGAGSDAK